jgi:hypothetical protein
MAGLKNRFITITFPEMTEEGDEPLYITLRNPKLVPVDWLRSRIALTPSGEPVNPEAATQEGYERLARLITDIRMYDAEDESLDQGMLTMPMTAEKVARLPLLVNARIADELNRVGENPTTTPDSPTS